MFSFRACFIYVSPSNSVPKQVFPVSVSLSLVQTLFLCLLPLSLLSLALTFGQKHLELLFITQHPLVVTFRPPFPYLNHSDEIPEAKCPIMEKNYYRVAYKQIL